MDLLVSADDKAELRQRAAGMPSLVLDARRLCDLELLATGGFSPLNGFMNEQDYRSVLETMRLADGTLFPVPITLPSERPFAIGSELALCDPFGNILAVLRVDDAYEWDPMEYRRRMLGSEDKAHPLVRELGNWGLYNLSGRLQVLELPAHYDFAHLRRTPQQVREALTELGGGNVVAFQTRNPMHRQHEELTRRAAESAGGTLLIHPVVGMTKAGDVDYITRVRCYQALVEHHYKGIPVMLSLLPLAMRMAGPREAVWHAIIRRNFGATHFISGRDHAGPGKDSTGKPFYGAFEARDLVRSYEQELGIKVVHFGEMAYLPDEKRYEEMHKVQPGRRTAAISGTQAREDYLARGIPLPAWFTRPRVAEILASAYPPRTKQGFCVWFTGLSGAGKSTIAQALRYALQAYGRRVTLLDGDIIRRNLSQGLGFSRADRDTNVRRIGFVAERIVEHQGVALVAAISPYAKARAEVRAGMAAPQFIEVYVSTPLEVCQQRDPKGLYAKAATGQVKGVTGIDDAYEPPHHPEVTLDGAGVSVRDSVTIILDQLRQLGFLD